jgi:hypothetical protein
VPGPTSAAGAAPGTGAAEAGRTAVAVAAAEQVEPWAAG